MEKSAKPKLDKMSLDTWARLARAGVGPEAGKPAPAEVWEPKVVKEESR